MYIGYLDMKRLASEYKCQASAKEVPEGVEVRLHKGDVIVRTVVITHSELVSERDFAEIAIEALNKTHNKEFS